MNERETLEQSPLARAPARSPLPGWARQLAVLLDGAIRIPGTDIRVGLDPILGVLLPELGDALSALLSLTLLFVAYRERVPAALMLRLVANIGLDALLGAIPLLGDVFDFTFKANERNLALLEQYWSGAPRRPSFGDRALVFGLVAVAVLVALAPLVIGIALVRFVLSHLG